MKEELFNYYKEMLINTFPLSKSDIVNVIKSDLYNRIVRGYVSHKEQLEILDALGVI